jgi:hypothetical protein
MFVDHCTAGIDDGLEGDPETLDFTATSHGTYFIVVDSGYATSDDESKGPYFAFRYGSMADGDFVDGDEVDDGVKSLTCDEVVDGDEVV